VYRVNRSVVKWAGGKRKLLPELRALVPSDIGTYFEPFCGGAALFFALADSVPRSFSKAVLTDQNEDLMALYQALRDELGALIAVLKTYRYDRDLFYEVRAQSVASLSRVERGARLLFLNKTCFNGLWRVNASGQFNVPFGTYKDPKICDEAVLRNASVQLQRVSLRASDFLSATKNAKEGDFVYFDPPYVPLSKTALFTSYGQNGFGPTEQRRLSAELVRLKKLGVRAVLSNHDTVESRALYKGMWCRSIQVRRSINSDKTKRGTTGELLVANWRPGNKDSTWEKLK
jgi:DNA adenine methylase